MPFCREAAKRNFVWRLEMSWYVTNVGRTNKQGKKVQASSWKVEFRNTQEIWEVECWSFGNIAYIPILFLELTTKTPNEYSSAYRCFLPLSIKNGGKTVETCCLHSCDSTRGGVSIIITSQHLICAAAAVEIPWYVFCRLLLSGNARFCHENESDRKFAGESL